MFMYGIDTSSRRVITFFNACNNADMYRTLMHVADESFVTRQVHWQENDDSLMVGVFHQSDNCVSQAVMNVCPYQSIVFHSSNENVPSDEKGIIAGSNNPFVK